MSFWEARVKQIDDLTASLQSPDGLNPDTRAAALASARKLLDALESPAERIMRDMVMYPAILMAIRMGVQLGIFTGIRPEGTTLAKIAETSGADPIVINQVIRPLVATGYVLQDGQTFKPSALTTAMAGSTMQATARACFDVGNMCTAKAPEFFRKNNNQFPASINETPFQLAMGTQLPFFGWLGENPALAADFHSWMAWKEQATLKWTDWFDIQTRILDGFTDDGVLLVDVAGGAGQYLTQFRARFPHQQGRLVLQDLPQVVASMTGLPGAELQEYDFFNPQPIQGARVYFLHWVLHDWSDAHCRSILANIVAAMKPGYSRLIIHETILPESDCDLMSASMSVMMMALVAAFERSEGQWRELLSSVGLTAVTFFQPPGMGEGIIEAIKLVE
ncbi:hypothetical protein ASPZODRAFT_100391 [Penicilliopsis zonata CBS 506.65]|uniref:O-methyltransferase C-terminal domain-containing protein n=1 Tax=Penicilliopsis zonata CBS 506.65 TaxID=1073090 RepID=A0A1L9SD60_9EURO|nr:hypothetical protein ASPZODRAFT_100391 [Penicilliopsis zonata CBS 506.65]OJJ45160.1 hypothetical protein ASPZODRAFT_100391 [Penicilliopsis zonata CBS 506.65]